MPQATCQRRGALRALAALPLFAWAPPAAWAASHRATAARLDAIYIPALFLTGSAGKSEAGAVKAREAMQRLQLAWPALRPALAAQFPGDADWQRALQQVGQHIDLAAQEVARAAWAASHETLEQVRLTLFKARRARSVSYLLDEFTAYHEAMEAIANAPEASRDVLSVHYAKARALWRPIEQAHIEPADWGLSAARQAQLSRALADEGAALSRLSQVLAQNDPAAWREAAVAIKTPFVQAYTAFGWPAGETQPLRD